MNHHEHTDTINTAMTNHLHHDEWILLVAPSIHRRPFDSDSDSIPSSIDILNQYQ